jgi:hypothetical protein
MERAIAAKDWCPKHGREERIYPVRGRESEVFSCGTQVYCGVGTIREKSTTPFETWKAIYRAVEADPLIPIQRLQRTFNINWRTARRIKRLIVEHPDEADIMFAW